MGRGEAERFIEADRLRSVLVGGELNQSAAALAAKLDRVTNHQGTDAAASVSGRDADAFYLAAPHASAGEAGKKGELNTTDDFIREHRDE